MPGIREEDIHLTLEGNAPALCELRNLEDAHHGYADGVGELGCPSRLA